MMRRAIPAFAILIALSQTATAGVPLFGHVSCTVVRFYVAKYSEAAAEKWARGHGYSDSEIETARRCLHSTNVQTATAATSSQVPTRVAEPERATQEPERDPNQGTPHVAAVQAQRADTEQVSQDNQPGVNGFIRPKDGKDHSAGNVSHATKELAPSDKQTTARPRYARATHRAGTGHVSWLKRLWNYLTRRRQFNVAALHFSGGRR